MRRRARGDSDRGSSVPIVSQLLRPLLSARRRAIGLVLLGTFALWSQGESLPDEVRFRQPLVVGSAVDSYPKSFATPNGRAEGFVVELLDAVASVMDLKIERVKTTSDELHRRFQAGDFDLLETYSPGPGREAFSDFSEHYLQLHGEVFVRRNNAKIQTLADLNGAAVLLGTRANIAERVLSDHHIVPRSITYCSSPEEAIHLLNTGEYDAVFASRLTALSIIDRDKLKNIRSLGTQLAGYDIYQCFAVHKGDQALLARLNEGLAILHRTGQFDLIYDRWFGRFDTPKLSRGQVITYLAPTLGVALALATAGFFYQRALRRRLSGQAARLAESEALLAEAQRIAHVGHWRYDTATRSLSCSVEMMRILERDPQKGPPTYARLLAMVPKSDRVHAHRSAREAMLKGASGETTVAIYPKADLRKVVQIRFKVVRRPNGKIGELVGTVQDITQQKFFEDDLRTREQLLRAIYDHVPSALGVVEETENSFRFISANPGTVKLLGLDPQTAIAGQLVSALGLSDDVANFWLQWFQRGVAHRKILKVDPELDQGKRHLSLTLIPLGFGPQGNAQLCYLAEDISERKQIDAEIAQGRRLRAVGELVGGIAHEFNNLLTPILLKTDLLRSEFRSELRLAEELRTISRAAERGADLTKRLLAFGRRSEAQPEEFKLNAVIDANLDLLRPTIDRRIQIINSVPTTLPPLFLNLSDLHQIVLNLLLNARDTLVEKLNHSPADTWHATIRLEAAQFGVNAVEHTTVDKSAPPTGWLCLTVRDNGMGMPKPVLERIFEPFYTTKGVGKGTGLGLATVWHLATRMGGKVTVQSNVDEGSVFEIWLPILAVTKTPFITAERVHEVNRTAVRICLVEDDDLVAATVSTALRRQDHQVVHFRHGDDAWRHLSKRFADYDLLLLDVDLPGISGVELARRVRTTAFMGKILVASGRLSEAEARELEKIGVNSHIEKPFSPPKLNHAVQSCMTARKTAGVL